jgi:hypothetical protein
MFYADVFQQLEAPLHEHRGHQEEDEQTAAAECDGQAYML